MYVVTGGAGFIGSAIVARLNELGETNILIVDELSSSSKWKNLNNKMFEDYLHKDEFIRRIRTGDPLPGLKAIIHMGACSSTTEASSEYLMDNNFKYTRDLCEYALGYGARFVYASSGATYGAGEQGYDDDLSAVPNLRPLNAYGFSKQLFDKYVIRKGLVDRVVGLKFFNVFGPNEYHKEQMASVVFHAFNQIKATGKVRLFKSYRADYRDGEQKRDFVYVKDCVKVVEWFLGNSDVGGIFNLGSGRASTWNELVLAVFEALGLEPTIEYIDMPENIRNQYQYFTEAKMQKLRLAGYKEPFWSLSEAVKDYVRNYLDADLAVY